MKRIAIMGVTIFGSALAGFFGSRFILGKIPQFAAQKESTRTAIAGSAAAAVGGMAFLVVRKRT